MRSAGRNDQPPGVAARSASPDRGAQGLRDEAGGSSPRIIHAHAGGETGSRLDRLAAALFHLGLDSAKNIQTLTALCGELLGADTALYNRLDGDLLHACATWQAPLDMQLEGEPVGHICFDVIRLSAERPLVVRDLPGSRYADSDPNVRAFGLRTYVGHPVRFGGIHRGSLCALWTRDVEPHEDDLRFLGIIASAIGQEEERARAERHLREREESLRLAMRAANQGLFDLDLRTSEGVVSDEYARMIGWEPSEFREQKIHWMDRVHPDDRQRVEAELQQYLQGERRSHCLEFRQQAKDGSWKWILSAGQVVERDDTGRPVRLLGTHTDLTNHKRIEEERLALERRLLHAQKMESLGVLAGGVAHDFNNLLLAIMGNVDLAREAQPPRSPTRANLDQAMLAARRAADLVRQMLAYAGRGQVVLGDVDIDAIVRDNFDLFRASVPKTVSLRFVLHGRLPPVYADAGHVRQLLVNLISNAAEALDGRVGTIVLTTDAADYGAESLAKSRVDGVRKPGSFVSVDVADDGCGMDEHTLERLFDPFFSTRFMGRGLGMAAVHGIVKAHGGAIFVNSQPAKGSSVRVLFPAARS